MSSPLPNANQPSLTTETTPLTSNPQDNPLLPSQQEQQSLLSLKRERDKETSSITITTTKCPKCGISSDKELLSFSSYNELVNYVQSNAFSNKNEVDIKSDLIEDSNHVHDKIDITLCYKCFYSNLFIHGLHSFISSSNEMNQHDNNNNNNDSMIYKTYLENIIQCIDNVKSALIMNITEHENLITKLQMQFFFEKNKTVMNTFNKEIEECKQQRIQTMETVKTLIDKTAEYSEINQILKSLPEDKLIQISEYIKSINNNTALHNNNNNILPINDDNNIPKPTTLTQVQGVKEKNKEDIKDIDINDNNITTTNTHTHIKQTLLPSQTVTESVEHNIITPPPITTTTTTTLNEPVALFNQGELKISSESSSIETNSKTTQKKNYIIRSRKPIHESNYKVSTTPISPLPASSTQEILSSQIIKQQQQSQNEITSSQTATEQQHQPQNPSQLNNNNSTLIQNNIPLKVSTSPHMHFMQMPFQNQINPALPLNPFNIGPPQLHQAFPPGALYDQGPMNSNFDLYNLVLKHGLLPNDKLNPTPPNLYNTTTTTNNNNQLFPIPSNPPFQPPAFYGIDPMLIASQQQFQKLGQKVQMNAPPNLTNLNNSSSQFEHGLIYGTLFPHQQDENDININTSNLFMKNTYGDLSKKNETKVQRNQMLTMNTNQQNTNSNVVSNNVNDSTKK